MSLVSTLALLATAAARIKPDRAAEDPARVIAKLRRELEIERQFTAVRERDLATERSLARHWLGEAQRLIHEKRELERERDIWRERALNGAPQPAGPDFRPPERGQAQLQYAQLQSAQAQQQWAHANAVGLQQLGGFANNAQLAQQHQLAMQNAAVYGQGQMLGAQALDPEMWCNCVPSRAQVWAAQQNDGD